jgi:hypothetical protein
MASRRTSTPRATKYFDFCFDSTPRATERADFCFDITSNMGAQSPAALRAVPEAGYPAWLANLAARKAESCRIHSVWHHNVL